MESKEYRELLKQRAKESRVYSRHQFIGLTLAEILEDPGHKSLYIRLAKQHNESELLHLARTIASNSRVQNKGAYFMRMLQESKKKRT